MPRTRLRRTPSALATLAAAGTVAVIALTGCVPTPAPSPGFVTDFGSNGAGAGQWSAANPAARAPAFTAPQTDAVTWQDCTDQLARRYNTAPANTTLQCASLTARIGPAGQPLRVALTRATRSDTPRDGAPVVLVGGTEFTGQRALATMAAADSPLIAARPVVAIERRGVGASSPLTCRTAEQRVVLRTGAESPTQPIDRRIDAIRNASTEAANACGDDYRDTITDFGAPAAAEDLDLLRNTWRVPALALLAVGDGSNTALAYAAVHPKQVARLVLDSPVRYGAPDLDRAEDAAKGTSAALTALAEQCGPDCAFGPDPAAAVTEVTDRAAAGRLGPFTDTDLRRATNLTLGIGAGDRAARIGQLAGALQAARVGDYPPLRGLLSQADDALGSDGQYIARCSDASSKPSPDQARDAAGKWSSQYRLGAAAALEPIGCTAWPTPTAPPPLTALEVAALIATPAADPFSSRDALETLTGQLTVASAAPATINWAGLGDGATVRSACTQSALVDYLERATTQPTRACPA